MSLHDFVTEWGGYLGVFSTIITVGRELTKGPKLAIKDIESIYHDHSTVTSSWAGDALVSQVNSFLLTRIQFQNSGNEMTSLVGVFLTLNSGAILRAQKTHKIDVSGSKLLKSLEEFPVRIEDDRIVTIAPGQACLETFQFDWDRQLDDTDRIGGTITFEFINHDDLLLGLEFKKINS